MANIIQGKDYISRAELARFVMDQFRLFASVRMAFHRQVAGTGSPNLVVLDRECKPKFKS